MKIDYESLRMGTVFEELRRKNRMTQEMLAEECDLDRTTVGTVERDSKVPTLDTFIRMAFAFQMTPSELFQEIEKKTNLLDYKNKLKH